MKWKLLFAGLTLAILVWVGYVAYAAVTAQPELEARWGKVSEAQTDIIIDGTLAKPLMVPVSIENLTIEFTGVPVAKIDEFNYTPTGRDIGILLTIDNHNLVRALVNYLNAGQTGEVRIILHGKLLGVVPINLDLKQSISEDILSRLNFTAESQEYLGGMVKTPALVETTFDWAGEENGKAVLLAHMKFYNPNVFPIPVGNVSYDVYANGIKAAYGKSDRETVLPAKGYNTLTLRTYIIESTLPRVWELHVKNGEESKVRADIFMTLKLMNNEYRIKLGSYEETVESNIMDQLNEILDSIGSLE